jgi:hypothetical protein
MKLVLFLLLLLLVVVALECVYIQLGSPTDSRYRSRVDSSATSASSSSVKSHSGQVSYLQVSCSRGHSRWWQRSSVTRTLQKQKCAA